MRPCAQCGTQNDDVRSVCLVCGADLPTAAPPAGPGIDPAKRTMLGIAPMAPGSAPSAPGLDPKKTMLGGVGPAPDPGLGATLIGRPDPATVGSSGGPATKPDAAPTPAPAPMRTMLGIAPIRPGAPTPAGPASAPAGPASAQAPGAAGPPSNVKTMLGVAMPGIAPLNPGVEKPRARTAAPASYQPPPQVEPTDDDLAVLPGRRSSKVPVIAIVTIAAAVLLAAAVTLVALVWRGTKPIEARVVSGATGTESLELACPECREGTTLSVAGRRGVLVDGKTTIELPEPLALGENEITVTVEQKGGKSEVDLVVPVEYRVRGEVGGLTESPPKLSVVVEATEGTAVVVDGQPIALTEGKGRHDIDVLKELTGPAGEVARLERKVPYTVTPRDGEPVQGEVVLSLGIVPLRVDAPGQGIVIDRPNFMLAGRTKRDGSIAVSGRAITVDTEGRFAQLMNVSSNGETTITVRATAPDHAPRLVPVRVKRVKSLQDEARQFAKKASDTYASIATDIDSKQGWNVVLEGDVVEARTENHVTILLLEARRGCNDAPCLARLIHGAKVAIRKGDVVTAYGRVNRAVEGLKKGKAVPEIAVDFLLSGARR